MSEAKENEQRDAGGADPVRFHFHTNSVRNTQAEGRFGDKLLGFLETSGRSPPCICLCLCLAEVVLVELVSGRTSPALATDELWVLKEIISHPAPDPGH